MIILFISGHSCLMLKLQATLFRQKQPGKELSIKKNRLSFKHDRTSVCCSRFFFVPWQSSMSVGWSVRFAELRNAEDAEIIKPTVHFPSMNSMWSAAHLLRFYFRRRVAPGGTPLDMHDQCRDVPLDRVWFLPLNPKQGV